MTPEGLIELDESVLSNGPHKVTRALVLLLTATVILGTTFIDVVFPLKQLRLQGAEARQYSQMRDNAHWSDGSLARFLEFNYRVRSRVRSAVGRPYANFLLNNLNEVGGNCVAGSDGWLYLRNRIEMAPGPMEIGPGRTAAETAFLARRILGLGMRPLLLPIPRKAAMAGEFLPISFESHREFDELVLDQYRRQGLEAVDVLPAWDANPDAEHVYQRRNSHWSTVGVRLAAEALARFAGMLAPEDKRLGVFRHRDQPARMGDLYSITNTTRGPGQMRYAEQAPYFVDWNGQDLTAGSPDADIALCGTSFSAHDTLAIFLSHYFGRPVQCFSSPGDPPEVSVEKLLQTRGPNGYPSVLIEEIPNHFPLSYAANPNGWKAQAATERIAQAYGPRHILPLALPIPVSVDNLEIGAERTITGGERLLDLPEGWIAQSGGGVVQFGLDLINPSGEATVEIFCGAFRWNQKASNQWRRYTFPILMQRPSCDRAQLSVRSKSRTDSATYTVGGWSLFTDVNPETAMPGELDRTAWQDGAASQQIRFAPGCEVHPQSTLVIQTSPGGGAWNELEVVFHARDGSVEQRFLFNGFKQGGWIVLVPGLLTGHELESVELRGRYQGKNPPGTWLSSANLYHVTP